MRRYTIEYWYGDYHGTEVVFAEDGEEAVALMWQRLKPHMTLSMAAKSAKIIHVEDE